MLTVQLWPVIFSFNISLLTLAGRLLIFRSKQQGGADMWKRLFNMGGRAMNRNNKGQFSVNFFSLQLQLKTLMDGLGGEETIQFLDELSSLSESEQKIALKIFRRTIKRLTNRTERLYSERDKILKDFEENLYQDIVTSMIEASNTDNVRKFKVLNGGKFKSTTKPLDLSKARKRRRAGKRAV
ncbi:MAG: hypothetical protein D6719_07065 [Candidatus Dadabacteria bacterium]|nr:MAG: hypothetical protein D6719_07065 [Candidatus Dadabacteria bacterium]